MYVYFIFATIIYFIVRSNHSHLVSSFLDFTHWMLPQFLSHTNIHCGTYFENLPDCFPHEVSAAESWDHRRTGNTPPNRKSCSRRCSFNRVILTEASAADLLSIRIPNMKSVCTDWNVMITFPSGRPIRVSISTYHVVGASARNCR